MNAGLKLAAFAMALVLVFGAAALAGDTVGPDRSGESRAETGADGGGHADDADAGGHAGGAAVPAPVRGLSVSQAGLTLKLDGPVL